MGELFATLFVLIIYLCITEKWGGGGGVMNAYQLQTGYVWGVSRDSSRDPLLLLLRARKTILQASVLRSPPDGRRCSS